jgi:Na+/H+ antiporter NhaD/arsenite permease-like protein
LSFPKDHPVASHGRLLLIAAFLGLAMVWTARPAEIGEAQTTVGQGLVVGSVHDRQGQPISGAHASLIVPGTGEALADASSQPDGEFVLSVSGPIPEELALHIEREHFKDADIPLDSAARASLRAGQPVALPDMVMFRRVTASFWIAAAVFVGMLILIARGDFHNTLAALLGASVIFAFSYLGRPLYGDFYIFNFAGALRYIDWNVIFLVMGMMIVIATVERTGIFQWLAYNAYRLSGGRIWLLVPILMLVAGIASAFLDNVTTMLLMTPITIQIALALGINPLALLMPEVMTSNVAGISTLIGTPTNILIGSYGQISFNAFLSNLTPGVLIAMLGLVIYSELAYKEELQSAGEGEMSDLLLSKLAERANITEPIHLRKAGVVGLAMLILFVVGEHFNLLPSITALMGATALLIWIRPDIEEMIEAVDWTTLVFFIALFIVVGAIQEVGLVSFIADGISRLVGGNLIVAVLVVTWSSALLSTVIANIPFTAAMLPVIGYLTATVPGAGSKVLFYCLSVGSAMGGNGSLIGASANMVAAGIAERAGYPITYKHFLKRGFPALLITVALASLWLVVRFIVLHETGQ